jgi:hypothetical protein
MRWKVWVLVKRLTIAPGFQQLCHSEGGRIAEESVVSPQRQITSPEFAVDSNRQSV